MANLPPQPPGIDVSFDADVLIVRLVGDHSLDVAIYLEAISRARVERYGYYVALVDVTRAGPITPDARRYLVEERRRHMPLGAAAVVGANFAVRTLATMVIRATTILAKKPQRIEFFTSEVEARAWLDKERIRLAEQSAREAHSAEAALGSQGDHDE